MFRLVTVDVSGARTTWFKFNQGGYGVMFMDGGTSGFVIRLAFHGNELTESAVYLERGGLIHLPEGFAFDRFFIQHVADAGTVTLAILEKPSKDRPIYQRGGFSASPASPLPVSLHADPLPVVQSLDPLPVKSEEVVTFGTIINPAPGNNSAFYTGFTQCRLSRISFHLQTDGNTATRRVYLQVQNATTAVMFEIWSHNSQILNLGCYYTFAMDLYPTASLVHSTTALPKCEMDGGWQFRINCINIQVGDQFSNISFSLVDVLH